MKFSDLGDNGPDFIQRRRMKEGIAPELSALKKEFGKFTQHYDRMDTDPESAASYNKQQADRTNRDVADSDIDDEDFAADMGQDREDDLDEASLAQMRNYFNQPDDSIAVNRGPAIAGRNPAGIPHEIQTLVNKMYHAGKISPQEFEILRKFQQQTKINVGIREADKNPYAIGMAQAMKSTGDRPPLKKSTINKAHEIARAIKKGE